jgi:hypothetical protein
MSVFLEEGETRPVKRSISFRGMSRLTAADGTTSTEPMQATRVALWGAEEERSFLTSGLRFDWSNPAVARFYRV